MPLAVVGPAQRQDLPLAAAGEQKKPDRGDLEGPFFGMRGETRRQAAELVVGQEPLAPLPAVAPDAPARVRPLRAKTLRLGLPHDDGKHRHRPVGRDRRRPQRGEPLADVRAIDLRDGTPREMGQELFPEIGPVHLHRARLPHPLVLVEHGLGNRLEQRLLGPGRHGLAPPDGREHLLRARARLVDADRAEIADGLPDPLSPVLAMDEKEFPSRWRHPDAEAPEPGVAAFVGDLARNQRPDSGVGEVGCGHMLSPGFGCTGEGTIASSVPRLQNGERKNDPFSNG